MKWLLFWSVMFIPACSGAADNPSEAVARGQRDNVSVTEFKALHDKGDIVVIDVRTDKEWKEGHVPNARHIPLSDLTPASLADHDKSQPVYFICHSGGRSGRAADAMSSAGFHAVNVQGGTAGWRKAGYPVE